MNLSRGINPYEVSASRRTDEWLTPPSILHALGSFDLDPCAAVDQPWLTAMHHYTALDDGLSRNWFGRVWLNPPYGRATGIWLERLAKHGNGIALIFARTETAFFHRWVWERATALLFLEGRINFHHANGDRAKANSGAPSVLIAYGQENAVRLASSKLRGAYVTLPAMGGAS